MRRFLAIALAVLIGLPAISPLLALSAAEDATRPACCRRDGKHHCMLVDMERGSSATGAQTGTHVTPASVSERCPYGAKAALGRVHPDWTMYASGCVFRNIAAHPSIAPQTESKRRIAADRSRRKRGPPAITLA